MRRTWIALAVWGSLALSPLGLRAPLAQTTPVPQARVIVKYKASAASVETTTASTTTERAQAMSRRTGVPLSEGRQIAERVQVVRASGLSSDELASRLSQDSEVEYAVVDQRRRWMTAPNDTRYASGQTTTPVVGQWYLRAPSGSAAASINAEGAWMQATGAGVVVAVLDTGVRFDHPDLAAKLYAGYDFITDTTVANDGSARDGDASDPGDWITSAESTGSGELNGCDVDGSSWHGTQTAGIVGAATNNGIGMAGVGGDAMILPLRVLGKCGGYDSDIIAAMRWAVGGTVTGVPANAHPAKVLNLSLGSEGSCSQAYADVVSEVTAAGAVIVVSAGNDGLAVNSPANCSGVIAVAGLRHVGTKVGFSSLGPQVTIAAPGGNCVNTVGTCLYPILTSVNDGTTTPGTNTYSDGTNPSVGTSFSAPQVAGTAALMFSAKPSLTPAQLIQALKESATAFPTTGGDAGTTACKAPSSTAQTSECYCTTTTCGAGMLNAAAAVAKVAAVASPVIPVIAYNAGAAVPGGSVVLDSSASVLPSGVTVTAYQWSVLSGGGLAAFSSATNASTATLAPTANGNVTVRLTLTDSTGAQTSRDATLVVGTATTQITSAGASESGGGGALGWTWLAGLGLAVMVLGRGAVPRWRLSTRAQSVRS